MSADVYCQKSNNHFYTTTSFLYSNGKKGKRASCQRDRERVCARDGEWLKMGLVSVVKTADGRRINYFEISRDLHKDYVFVRNYFNGEERFAKIL
jgi:hypothetical protein